MASNRRLNIEIQNMMKDNNLERNHYCIELDGKTNSHLFGKIVGPPDTPFQRGVFTIDITIPDRYPLAPPACKFVTRVWHPNISSMTGAIGLDILHTQWSSAMTLESLLRSIQSVLPSPEPNGPKDVPANRQYVFSRELYTRTARYWTYHYAMNDETRRTVDKNQFKEFKEKVQKVMAEKSIDHDSALDLLSGNDWNLNKALN